jgi:hypothetical protein
MPDIVVSVEHDAIGGEVIVISAGYRNMFGRYVRHGYSKVYYIDEGKATIDRVSVYQHGNLVYGANIAVVDEYMD